MSQVKNAIIALLFLVFLFVPLFVYVAADQERSDRDLERRLGTHIHHCQLRDRSDCWFENGRPFEDWFRTEHDWCLAPWGYTGRCSERRQ